MDTFTIVLIVLAAVLVVVVVVAQVRGRNRPGHHISSNAAMGGNDNNAARYTSDTNIHDRNGFGGVNGGL